MIPERFSPLWFDDGITSYEKMYASCTAIKIRTSGSFSDDELIEHFGVREFLGCVFNKEQSIFCTGMDVIEVKNPNTYRNNARIHLRYIEAFKIDGRWIDLKRIQRRLGFNNLEKHMWIKCDHVEHGKQLWLEVHKRLGPHHIQAYYKGGLIAIHFRSIVEIENTPPKTEHEYKEMHSYIQVKEKIGFAVPGQWYPVGERGTWYVSALSAEGPGFVDVPNEKIAKYTELRVSTRPSGEEKVLSIGHQAFRRLEPGMWVKLGPACIVKSVIDEEGEYREQFYYQDKLEMCGRWHKINSTNLEKECVYIHPALKKGGFAFHYHFIVETSRTEPEGERQGPLSKLSTQSDPLIMDDSHTPLTLAQEIECLQSMIVKATGIPKEFFTKEMTMEETVKQLEGIDTENLAKAKAIVDEQLATEQQQKAARAYTSLLNQKDALEKVLADTEKQLKVVNEGLKKFDEASKKKK